MKIWLCTRSNGKSDTVNGLHEFAGMPREGEYLTLSETSDWYQVQLVVHTPFKCHCDAEVYAVKVNHAEVKKAKLTDL